MCPWFAQPVANSEKYTGPGRYGTIIRAMGDWWERRWIRRHATAAPFGIFIATVLLTYFAEQNQWNGRASLQLTAKMVDLGAVLYAMLAVLVERGVLAMFWALDKRREWREKMRAEMRAELMPEVRAETMRRYEAWLARVAGEKDIALEDLLPREEDLE
jgi:hypothetical protein